LIDLYAELFAVAEEQMEVTAATIDVAAFATVAS